jgi:hypothetical protein
VDISKKVNLFTNLFAYMAAIEFDLNIFPSVVEGHTSAVVLPHYPHSLPKQKGMPL